MAQQRIHPDGLVDCLVSTFGTSAIKEFRTFLAKHPLVTKWTIATDYVIGEPQAAHDAYAYTFFPYDTDLQVLKAKIAGLVPKDFKKTKTVEPKLHKFLQSGATFTICLLTPKKYKIAGDIHAVRRGLDQTLATMRSWHDAENQGEMLKAFERLRERANANNFSAQLTSTMMIATVMAAFCATVLAQERRIEIVGWFPDRDNITTAYDRVAQHMFGINFLAFCQRHGIANWRSIKTIIGLPEPDPAKPEQSWYDELVRVPDFFAGPLAGWNFRENLVTGRQKYVDILRGAVADNPNVVTLLLVDTEKGIGVSRLLCSQRPISPRPDGEPETMPGATL
jgi:hypothetical protein